MSTLKCLLRRGRLSDVRPLCASAAMIGDLEALKALRRAKNFPWGMSTCAFAAWRGHLEMLKWARANGCPWNWHAWRLASEKKRRDVVHWLKANGCPTARPEGGTDDHLYTWTSGADEWAPSDPE